MTTKVQAEFLAPGIISDQTQVSAASGDHVLIFDASDNSLKKCLISTIAGGLALDDIGSGDAASTLATSSGNIILDTPGDVVLDAGGEKVAYKVNGTLIGEIDLGSANFTIRSSVSDNDTLFVGNDGGTEVESMRIDYSAGGEIQVSDSMKFSAKAFTFTDSKIGTYSNNYMYMYGGSAGLIMGDNSGGSNRILIRDSNSIELEVAGNQRAVFDSSGNMALGSTAAAGRLHVQKDASETDLIVRSNTGGTGSAQGGRILLQLGAQSNSGSGNADTQAGDILGKIRFDGQGTDYSYQGGEVSCIVQTGDGSALRGEQGTRMSFYTMNVGVGYAQERFRIAQNGDLTATDTSIGSLSDERIKQNIADFTGGLDIVKSLQPRTFEYKDTSGLRKAGTHRGFIAQEVLANDPYWIYEQEATDTEHEEYEFTADTERVYVSKLSAKDAMYVSAIKELEARVRALEEA
tara:strand:- start:44 stop:1429 length:1386 start_codon:yes stop_codon:yes gene_type:complete